MAETDISQNAAFMDLYSRQIGAYGIETMSKLINMKVLIVGLRGLGVEAAKNIILAGPGSVTLADDEPAEIRDLGGNFFLSKSSVGHPRATQCAAKLQELNTLVKVHVHSGSLTEDLMRLQDVVIFTTNDRSELIRWNEFCRNNQVVGYDNRGRSVSRPDPIRFIAVSANGAMGVMFTDFGPEFSVSDQTGEPPVQRVITNVTCEQEGIVTLLDPNESELAKKADVTDNDHEGFISFSEIEGMYCRDEHSLKRDGHSINSSGTWRAREIWKKVPDYLLIPKDRGGDGTSKSIQYFVHVRDPKTGEYKKDSDKPDGLMWKPLFPHECADVSPQDFVRDEYGNKAQRMTVVKEHYKLKIGDTRGYSKYLGGGIMQQVYQPVTLHHHSFVQGLQQPIGANEATLLAVDGEKEATGWWYPMLHILHCAILQFHATAGRMPKPGDEADADAVLDFAKHYNASMRALQAFCGPHSALATTDLSLPPMKPPTKQGLTSQQEALLEALVEMGLDESKALLCLSACDWDSDAAMMKAFDEGAVAELEGPLKTFRALEAMRKLALTCGVEIQPVAVFMGGICAQEVVKHCGKFTPLNQVLYYDCIEVLPSKLPPAIDRIPLNCRYDNNIMIFGKHVQEEIRNLKTFMVGCGALGCELLKNFAMLGVACGPKGLVTVTDGDRIEVSNLNRQFLFRKQHVKMSKSLTAGAAVKEMNPDINVDALELLAMRETEKVFNDDFWMVTGHANAEGSSAAPAGSNGGIDITINALDNVKARKYVDSRCVFYHKPLLESGTEGTKFNHQIVIPGVTVSYDEGEPDAPEGEAIPMCTLRNFPSTIIHCIEWSRGLFEDLYVTPAADLADYLKDPSGYIQALRDDAESFSLSANDVQNAIEKLCDKEGHGLIRSMRQARQAKDVGFSACVRHAYELFLAKFNFAMRDLQHQFPKDKIIDGKPFWSPPKRYPEAWELDLNDESVASFIISAANLYAVSYGIHPLPVNGIDSNGFDFDTFVPSDSPCRNVDTARAALPREHLQWQPSAVKIDSGLASAEAEENPQTTQENSLQDLIANLIEKLNELSAISTSGIVAQPADFEKDLDMNFHIDFVAAASNIRASNYGISRATRHKTKMIAGKIIAAIATSTACATALVSIELLKLVQRKKIEDFRDSSCSFATNRFQMSTPTEAKVIKGRGEKKIQPDPISQPQYFDEMGNVLWDSVPSHQWMAYPDPHTKWDKIKMSASLSLEGAIEYLRSEHGLKLKTWGVTVLDENGKTTGKQIYSEAPAGDGDIDEDLLVRVAPLDVPEQKAKIAIMRCADMKNKQAYTARWQLLKRTKSDEHRKKMQATVRDLLDTALAANGNENPLAGVREYPLELTLEIAGENGVEALTPPVVITL